MEFALMANVVLQGACLGEADMSGAQLDAAVLTGADLRKANLRGAGLRALHGSTAQTSAMQDLVARSLSEPRCAAPICVVRIYAWQSSTGRTCLMPTWRAWKT
jgi:Pentapeptide repeats (8 copies)